MEIADGDVADDDDTGGVAASGVTHPASSRHTNPVSLFMVVPFVDVAPGAGGRDPVMCRDSFPAPSF